jgi:hypothetical protein
MTTTRMMKMLTKRFKEARGINENTKFYGFYVRATGESRDLLKLAQKKASGTLGSVPSNPVLLDELLRSYVLDCGMNDHKGQGA